MLVPPVTPDSGAARERTALAWRRTALACAVNGVLLLRASDAWIEVAALGVLAAATATAALSAARFRQPDAHGWLAGRTPRGLALLGIAGAIAALDAIAIVRG